MQNTIARHTARTRKGFSLVELVIVIIIIAILAVAVFAGGSITVKKSQVSRTISDLHNFAVAVEATLNEMPDVANITKNETATDGEIVGTKAKYDNLFALLNKNLSADYQIKTLGTTSSNITTYTNITDDGIIVYESAKKDSWNNPYYLIVDCNERNGDDVAEFYITVVSAGPNAKTALAGTINEDDIFMLCQYTDGNVASMTYNWAETAARAQIGGTGVTAAATVYDKPAANAPVNFKPVA